MDLELLRRTESAAIDDGGIFLDSASISPMSSRSVALLDRGRPQRSSS